MNAEIDHALDQFAIEQERMETSMYGLNTRIARLALALGVHLDRAVDVHALIQDSPAWSGPHEGAAWREAQAKSELRALLVMRYQQERLMIKDLGVHLTQRILEDVELHMLCAGFEQGADGIGLDGVLPPDDPAVTPPCPPEPV